MRFFILTILKIFVNYWQLYKTDFQSIPEKIIVVFYFNSACMLRRYSNSWESALKNICYEFIIRKFFLAVYIVETKLI